MLRLGGATVAGSAVAGSALAEDRAPAPKAPTASGSRRPKNIIFLVSDGMSMGVPTMAEELSRLTRHRGTVWQRLLEDRSLAHGFLRTDSLSGPVTDSSAASSAWGSGRQVRNGSVNMYPDGTELTPIAAMARERGIRSGLVTTDHICGGTPCGFAACRPSRSMKEEIALDYLERVDVLLGGGRHSFRARNRDDKVDMIEQYKAKGYDYHETRGDVVFGRAGDKVLGLYHDDLLPYTIDHVRDETQRRRIPTLAEMTRFALRCLNDSPEGFFLMVEASRVDHAAHLNDAATMLHEQLAFDDAIAVALDYTQQRDDTLLVITSDHGNSNPGLNGVGSGYVRSADCFARLANFQASFPVVMERLRHERESCGDSVCAARKTLKEMLGLDIDDAEAKVVGQALLDDQLPEELSHHHRNKVGVLGQVVGNHIGVGWTSVSHTSDHVILSAVGPGSEAFACLQHHVDVHAIFADHLKLESRNPTQQQGAA
jgi:alkaline phosphatase